jgi:hypothetical protein
MRADLLGDCTELIHWILTDRIELSQLGESH